MVSQLMPDTSPLRNIDNPPIDKCNPVFFAAVKQYFSDLGHKWRYIKLCKTLETHAQGQLDEKMMVDRVKELIGSKQELWDESLRLWDIDITPPS
jgi:histone deacetylase complex regulatory component SIN3